MYYRIAPVYNQTLDRQSLGRRLLRELTAETPDMRKVDDFLRWGADCAMAAGDKWSRMTALHIAISRGYSAAACAMVDTLARNRPARDIDMADNMGVTPAMTAAARGDAAVLERLLSGGHTQIEARNGMLGFTALMEAVAAGHADCAALLIAAGADMQARDLLGRGLDQLTSHVTNPARREAMQRLLADAAKQKAGANCPGPSL